jgi:hypothetical protein
MINELRRAVPRLKACFAGTSIKAVAQPELNYYEALLSRLQCVPGAPIDNRPDSEKEARIVEAIAVRVIFEFLRDRSLNCILSLGKSGKYQAIVAGRYSASADNAFKAVLTAFMNADKAGLFTR